MHPLCYHACNIWLTKVTTREGTGKQPEVKFRKLSHSSHLWRCEVPRPTLFNSFAPLSPVTPVTCRTACRLTLWSLAEPPSFTGPSVRSGHSGASKPEVPSTHGDDSVMTATPDKQSVNWWQCPWSVTDRESRCHASGKLKIPQHLSTFCPELAAEKAPHQIGQIRPLDMYVPPFASLPPLSDKRSRAWASALGFFLRACSLACMNHQSPHRNARSLGC